MSPTKTTKTGAACTLSKERTDNPKLCAKKLSDGRLSLYLNYYLGFQKIPAAPPATGHTTEHTKIAATTAITGRGTTPATGHTTEHTTGRGTTPATGPHQNAAPETRATEPHQNVTLKYPPSRTPPRPTVKVIRRKEFLSLYLYDNPRTPEERQHNKDVNDLAKQIRYEREQERLMAGAGYRIPRRKGDIDFLQYYRDYIAAYAKKDADILRISFSRFTDFLRDTPKYSDFSRGIKPTQMTKDLITAFTQYLQTRSRGGGAKTIYSHFKKVVKYATEHDIFVKNPCNGISIKVDTDLLSKDVLSMDEIVQLVGTPFKGNPHIRRAFLFSLYTGVRYCDVRELKYGDIDFSNKLLKFTQKKTEGHSTKAVVTIPLNNNTLGLIGDKGPKAANIFPLPTFATCCAHIRRWVADAGIEKHITWHCARHSFAVNILNNGANIKTVSSLLGHSSISMTEKYLHAVDALKRQAVDSLPQLSTP